MSKNLKIIINFTLYILCFLVVCLIGSSGVFALTYTNLAELRDITQQLVSTNYGNAPYTNPINSGYAFNEVLQVDYIISNYNFVANTNYQLESHLTNQQLDNANYYSVQGLNGESCLISYQNSIFQDAFPRWAFQCPHNTNTITITIKNSSNQYLWSGTGIFNWTTALLKSSDTSLSGGNDNTDAIINNQNQNTQDIINNQNQNTQDIINSNKVCQNIDKTNIFIDNKYLTSNNSYGSSNNYGITNYFKIDSSSIIKVLASLNSDSAKYCFYNINKELISCGSISSSLANTNLTIPTNSVYFRTSIQKTQNKPTFELCKNGSQSLDDTLKDDSVDENGVADAFDNFNDFLDDNSTITQLITLPITLYTAILNNLDGTCSPFNLGKLYGEDLILPCINISQYLGNSLWTMIDIIISGFAVYAIGKKMIKVFNNFSSLREGDVIDD